MQHSTTSATTSEFLTVRELAALLRLSPTGVYRLCERRRIPFHRLSQGLRFRRADVEAYLESRRFGAVDPDTGKELPHGV